MSVSEIQVQPMSQPMMCGAAPLPQASQRKQVAQPSQTDRAAGCVSFGQKWKMELGGNMLGTL